MLFITAGLSFAISVTALVAVLIYAHLRNQFLSALLEAIEKTDIEIRACIQQQQADINSLKLRTNHACQLVECVTDDLGKDRKAFDALVGLTNCLVNDASADRRLIAKHNKRIDALFRILSDPDPAEGTCDPCKAREALEREFTALRPAESNRQNTAPTAAPDSVAAVRAVRDEWEERFNEKRAAHAQAMEALAVAPCPHNEAAAMFNNVIGTKG